MKEAERERKRERELERDRDRERGRVREEIIERTEGTKCDKGGQTEKERVCE